MKVRRTQYWHAVRGRLQRTSGKWGGGGGGGGGGVVLKFRTFPDGGRGGGGGL